MRGLDNVGVAVRDLDRSLAFYGDQLQLEIAYRDDGSRSAGLNTGSSSLYFFETAGLDGPRRTPEYVRNPIGIDHLSFAVDDVDAVYLKLRMRGVEFFMEPHDADWGAGVCGCFDPDAIPVYFLMWAAG